MFVHNLHKNTTILPMSSIEFFTLDELRELPEAREFFDLFGFYPPCFSPDAVVFSCPCCRKAVIAKKKKRSRRFVASRGLYKNDPGE